VSYLDRLRGRSEQASSVPDAAEEPPDSLLDRLAGEELSSVIFVRDYAQFDFNGPRLSTYVWPLVEAAGPVAHERRFGDQGYRDALCELIGRTVTEVCDSPDNGVVIRFDQGALVINPEPDDLQGPEIATLQTNDEDGTWAIWRPGEGCFSHREW
jgi:hypothetical protein